LNIVRFEFLEDGVPNLLPEVGCDGGDKQGGAADPVQDEVGVHADVASHLAVPIPDALEIVEPKFQGILVV